jgi:hypothetical protein
MNPGARWRLAQNPLRSIRREPDHYFIGDLKKDQIWLTPDATFFTGC